MTDKDDNFDVEEIREWLITTAENNADWRARKAAEYPDDIRNVHSEAALRALAEQIRSRPIENLRLHRLWQKVRHFHQTDQIDKLCEIESELFRQYGFSGEPITPDAAALIDEYTQELEVNDEDAPPVEEFLALLDKCRAQVEAIPEVYTASPHLYGLQHRIYLRLCGGNIPFLSVTEGEAAKK